MGIGQSDLKVFYETVCESNIDRMKGLILHCYLDKEGEKLKQVKSHIKKKEPQKIILKKDEEDEDGCGSSWESSYESDCESSSDSSFDSEHDVK